MLWLDPLTRDERARRQISRQLALPLAALVTSNNAVGLITHVTLQSAQHLHAALRKEGIDSVDAFLLLVSNRGRARHYGSRQAKR